MLTQAITRVSCVLLTLLEARNTATQTSIKRSRWKSSARSIKACQLLASASQRLVISNVVTFPSETANWPRYWKTLWCNLETWHSKLLSLWLSVYHPQSTATKRHSQLCSSLTVLRKPFWTKARCRHHRPRATTKNWERPSSTIWPLRWKNWDRKTPNSRVIFAQSTKVAPRVNYWSCHRTQRSLVTSLFQRLCSSTQILCLIFRSKVVSSNDFQTVYFWKSQHALKRNQMHQMIKSLKLLPIRRLPLQSLICQKVRISPLLTNQWKMSLNSSFEAVLKVREPSKTQSSTKSRWKAASSSKRC